MLAITIIVHRVMCVRYCAIDNLQRLCCLTPSKTRITIIIGNRVPALFLIPKPTDLIRNSSEREQLPLIIINDATFLTNAFDR